MNGSSFPPAAAIHPIYHSNKTKQLLQLSQKGKIDEKKRGQAAAAIGGAKPNRKNKST
jgi:hypothetical protein